MKYKKIILIILSIIIALSMCSCSEKDSYYLELQILPVIDDPSSVYLRASNNRMDEPIHLGLDTSYELGFYSRLSVWNSKTKLKELSFITQPPFPISNQSGYTIEEYNIINDEGDIKKASLKHSLETYYYTIPSGYLVLQNIAGAHEIKFTVPALEAYGIEKTSFYTSFIVDEDTREDAVEIVMSDAVDYTKINLDSFDNDCYYHDIYYCKQYPVFNAKVKASSDIVKNNINTVFRKLDENYYFNSPQLKISESGVYLCQVHYDGSDKYRAVNYYCYILL